MFPVNNAERPEERPLAPDEGVNPMEGRRQKRRRFLRQPGSSVRSLLALAELVELSMICIVCANPLS